jgi:hypothetical protein
MKRIAHCCCGSLHAEATGGPVFVVACHCREWQRRERVFGPPARTEKKAEVLTSSHSERAADPTCAAPDYSGANGGGDWAMLPLIGIATALMPEFIRLISGDKTNTLAAEVRRHITSHNVT